jgi:hypothetical protein
LASILPGQPLLARNISMSRKRRYSKKAIRSQGKKPAAVITGSTLV